MNRTGKLKPYFNIMGNIDMPILFTSDWHMGSLSFSELAYDKLIEDLDKYKIKNVVHLGDLLQGLGVYSKELKDLAIHDIDAQVDYATRQLEKISKKVGIHICIGGHEEVLKGKQKVGFDALRQLSTVLPNCTYYGDNIYLNVNKKYTFQGLHGSGASQYSTSYGADKLWNTLMEKPNILAKGHTHQLYAFTKPPNHLIMEVGSLQRETTFVSWRGITSSLGWYILKDYTPETVDLIRRIPRIY
jgi:predicted phosphodiesterase